MSLFHTETSTELSLGGVSLFLRGYNSRKIAWLTRGARKPSKGAFMKDSHGRVIDYMRISLTDRCNYRCIYCMPADGVTSLCHSDILSLEEIERVVRVAATMGIKRFRLTGGEPLGARRVRLTWFAPFMRPPVSMTFPSPPTACFCRSTQKSSRRRAFRA